MIRIDYPIAAMALLLERSCLIERYWPLTDYRETLIAQLIKRGCRSKSDAERLSDGELLQVGLPDTATAGLFRRFLALYDPKPAKFRELASLALAPEKEAAFRELYHLPGVKKTRAELYDLAGYHRLADLAQTTVEEILERTGRRILEGSLSAAAPLPKEARTHIAVAGAFTFGENGVLREKTENTGRAENAWLE